MNMLANHEMKANRFGKMAAARRLYASIIEHIAQGGRVCVGSYTRPKVYKNASQFKCGRDSVYVARGKHWDSLIFSPVVLID
jgi:hypothetical protein